MPTAFYKLTFTIAVMVAIFLQVSSSQAAYYGDAPWCAVINLGTGDMVWQCYYRSVEECAPNVVAGNRGFCNLNPYWTGGHTPSPAARSRSHKRHHGQVGNNFERSRGNAMLSPMLVYTDPARGANPEPASRLIGVVRYAAVARVLSTSTRATSMPAATTAFTARVTSF